MALPVVRSFFGQAVADGARGGWSGAEPGEAGAAASRPVGWHAAVGGCERSEPGIALARLLPSRRKLVTSW